MCIFPSFISNTSIVSINFRANLDAQNAENGIFVLQISKFLTLISNDKLWLIFFFTFCAFSSFFYFKFQSINFRANLDLRMQEMAFPCFKFQNFLGEYRPPRPPIHAWYIGHTRGLQPLLSPSDILSHRKVPFQKYPHPTGKSLKKALYVTAVVLSQYTLINLRLSSRMNTSKANRTAKSAQDSLCVYPFLIGTNYPVF